MEATCRPRGSSAPVPPQVTFRGGVSADLDGGRGRQNLPWGSMKAYAKLLKPSEAGGKCKPEG